MKREAEAERQQMGGLIKSLGPRLHFTISVSSHNSQRRVSVDLMSRHHRQKNAPPFRAKSPGPSLPPTSTELYDSLVFLLKPSSRYRDPKEISDGLKKIRKAILVDGVPELVSIAYR